MDTGWYYWSVEIIHIALKFHLLSPWKHGELWLWTTAPWCILLSRAMFLLVLVEHFTEVWGDHCAPAYPIVQNPVSNLEGLLEDFLSMDFNFPICPRVGSLQVLHWWNLSHNLSRELHHLETWCWRNPSWPTDLVRSGLCCHALHTTSQNSTWNSLQLREHFASIN